MTIEQKRCGISTGLPERRTACLGESSAYPDCPVLRLAEEAEAHLFRIAQEATHNAITHGRAKHIGISLAWLHGTFRLAIRDDGVGIRETAHRPTGIGLETMAYRARLIGGTLRVQRRAPRGTLVTCVFPLPAKNVEGKPHGQT